MKKVLIITYYWPPAGGPGVQRVLKFAKYFPVYGWQPIILTVKNGVYYAIDESLAKQIPVACRVYKTTTMEPNFIYKKFIGMNPNDKIPVAVLTENSSRFKKRLASFVRMNFFIPDAKIGWFPMAFLKGVKIIYHEKPDIIFSSSPPPTVHIIAMMLANYCHIKWIADFRDPWTRIHYYFNLKKNRISKVLDNFLERMVLNHAQRISAVNIGFFHKINSHKMEYLPNGFDSQDLLKVKPKKKNSKFIIRYTGAYKIRQYVESFFQILKELSADAKYANRIRVEFIGYVDPKVKDLILKKNCGLEVIFKNYIGHDKVIEMLQQADLLLLCIGKSDISHEIFSAKIFEYLMVKKPILAYGPQGGAADRLLKETGAGKMFDYNNYKDAKEYIIQHFNQWKKNKKYFKHKSEILNQYERKEITKKLVNIFEEVL